MWEPGARPNQEPGQTSGSTQTGPKVSPQPNSRGPVAEVPERMEVDPDQQVVLGGGQHGVRDTLDTSPTSASAPGNQPAETSMHS
ncbi:hypothetical protein AX774_g4366 [Zancudomyces culisetae]|uniref:Uncharacterized protein n=1 Tax=Zancudomyces culisetae TaxID=1213189 RepID=A0A1R1PMF9_ZANCU|nr:hypothetical protein AX774_g4366 [Zancudomyces culisetae]|eukprot:OMH82160.1 hypothetical protein AX774_g4366 [Zancudomyces culisetae]